MPKNNTNTQSTSTHWVGGIHAVRTLLLHGTKRIHSLQIDGKRQDRRLQSLLATAKKHQIPFQITNTQTLQKHLGNLNHQGVAALTSLPAPGNETTLDQLLCDQEETPLLLVLDNITDPHNLGACLRVADAAGVHAVIAPRDKATGLTPTACKVACGAAETVTFIQVTNLARTLRNLQDQYGVFVVGLADDSETSLYDADLCGPLAMVMGNEGQGLRSLTRKCCDQLLALPMHGSVESLNVSVATGVCVYEAIRQR
jgi:23S rRNA (guanosine2251-2'-O)-methyltransferase